MTFKDMHYGELPLLLPNAWDVLRRRPGAELPAADRYPEMQARLVRYADQKFSG